MISQLQSGVEYFLVWHFENFQILKGTHLSSQQLDPLRTIQTLRNIKHFSDLFIECKISCFLALLLNLIYNLMSIALESQLLQKAEYA